MCNKHGKNGSEILKGYNNRKFSLNKKMKDILDMFPCCVAMCPTIFIPILVAQTGHSYKQSILIRKNCNLKSITRIQTLLKKPSFCSKSVHIKSHLCPGGWNC